jgi:hypothetical protein
MMQKLIYSIFVFLSSEFSNIYVLFLESFLDEHAMVLRYLVGTSIFLYTCVIVWVNIILNYIDV